MRKTKIILLIIAIMAISLLIASCKGEPKKTEEDIFETLDESSEGTEKKTEVDIFDEKLPAGKSTKIEWLKPVFADDIIKGKAAVAKKEKCNTRNGLVEITIEAYNQHGELMLTDVTEAIVKCKPIN